MLDVKYKELEGSGLVTTPLNMAPNLSKCNVSHAGIAPKHPVALSDVFVCSPTFALKSPITIV